ncbi:pirin family protein [Melioribacter roseus P3M-2]|uniref:Pirin family protein n=1 Tax=Melioribacter roseus (strain DSM 23840 / JCM 17771 / VKM B-2668 / P3M-2) TaxID=1191523 RepID=I7A5V4_MELRP|nr:pirin family protein [Melioribacter roseus]AFN75276.1 pirin family protein [Melioribacter roseus P3M-2]
MLKIRKSHERGVTRLDWLVSYHTFSFGGYFDPDNTNFGDLRVINEDLVMPSAGFPTHPHNDMEIITIVYEGALEHRDSMGNGSVIRPNDVQIMSAGSGITHSEFNHSKEKPVRLLQIWIFPKRKGITPRYVEKNFPEEDRINRLQLLVSPSEDEGSLLINQDVKLYRSVLKENNNIDFNIAPGRKVWVQLISGSLKINEYTMSGGDGLAVENESLLKISSLADSDFLLFDLR